MGGHKKKKGYISNVKSNNVIAKKSKNKITTGFKDNFGVVHDADELVFPILYLNEKTDKFHVIGTGYFIHPNGGFITAKHVLFDNDGKELRPCYAVQTLKEGRRIVREIVKIFPHETADITVGMLKGQLKKNDKPHLVVSFPISLNPPNIGNKIKTYAFNKSEVKYEDGTQVGIFKGSWSVGEIQQLIKAGDHFRLKSDCYETSMHIAARASGGPVIIGTRIIGVNSSGWDLDNGDALSYITPISEIFDLVVSNSDGKEWTIRELMQSGFIPFVN